MNQVTVSKKKLLEKIKENREIHVAEYAEAHLLWVSATKDYYLKQIECLQIKNNELQDLRKPQKPSTHASDYDRVIAMLEMSIEPDVTLSAKEFEQYVLDTWLWTESFKSLTSSLKGL